mmetsp:Transcript_88406/g.249100  ORF Transcript_88406/g.249100 Transcript_88406/m.249100 type:complete len:206 (+) Transcript_88406:260-877(+)
MLSFQSPVSCHIFFVRAPLAKGASLEKSTFPSISWSSRFISRLTSFLKTRVALFNDPSTTVVLRSSTASLARWSLISCRMGASTVQRKRVAIVMPCAPMAIAAASWRPVADAPLAITGTESNETALARTTQAPTSSPGWPPAMEASYPTISTKSTPASCALRACRIVADLWSTLTPASCKNFMYFFGEPPATSSMATRSSATTLT